ncbi:hypothetical protein ECTPHS_10244 [Ectothiorhodospira sp. PHS-1]|nr:hypothetical protein ECTPHS_10244 [Ectothiorhodospira sp. PHS-1]
MKSLHSNGIKKSFTFLPILKHICVTSMAMETFDRGLIG